MALAPEFVICEAPEEVEVAAPVLDVPTIEEGFAHTVAHDMRSPLTAIQMCAETLSFSDDPGLREKYAGIILEQARSMGWALEHLLALADEKMWRTGEPQSVDLVAVARRSLSDLEGLAFSRDVSVVQDFPPESVLTEGFEEALQQAMRACAHVLLSSVPTGSRIIVTAGRSPDAEDGRGVSLSLLVQTDAHGSLDSLRASGLPWRRLSLVTAAHLIREHGGDILEVRGPDTIGIRLRLQ